MAGSGKNNANKSRGKKKESVPVRNPKKEAVGVCLIGLALILLYFSFAGGEIGIRQFLQVLAGYMLAGLALVVAWIGALLAFGGRDRRISPLRVVGIALLAACAFGFAHLFVADALSARIAVKGFLNFVSASYDARTGAGALGAVFAWPLYSLLGAWGAGIAMVFIALVDLVLMQKISVSEFAGHVREHVQEYRAAPRPERCARAADPPIMGSMYIEDVSGGRRNRRAREEGSILSPVSSHIPPFSEVAPETAPVRNRARAARETLVPSADGEQEIPRVQGASAPETPRAEKTESARERVSGAREEAPKAPTAPLPKIEPTPIQFKDDDEPGEPAEAARTASAPETAAADEEGEEEYSYPPIELLAPVKPSAAQDSRDADAAKAQRLEETLRSFGVETRLTGVAHGPAVTRFELKPAPGIKVSRITSLADDIALNLAAMSVRIEAPIPGKDAVGVEVPNDERENVHLREVLESPEARKNPSRLAVALGKDNTGRFVIADIAKMPHALIAGATGSGKSVCINSIICSILYRASPEEVRLILIDPKVVELSVYNEIPHLLVPVVTDPRKAASALQWAVCEMTDRYKKFAALGVRGIKGYNAALPEGESPMPQIVIIIDELADLMLVAPGEVEDSIQRLTQLARAAGIHLVIATQRPSVNVITGVIKANIPVRIAFQVASQVDSRTILDAAGAEKLLGNGDMLFATSTTHRVRVQGAWVSDDEVQKITHYLAEHHEAEYNHDVIEHMENAELNDAEREEASEEYDELLPKAIEIVIDAGQASISMLQRKMKIGYARAGRLIDDMAARGIVSPSEGAKPREVLMTREQFHQMFGE